VSDIFQTDADFNKTLKLAESSMGSAEEMYARYVNQYQTFWDHCILYLKHKGFTNDTNDRMYLIVSEGNYKLWWNWS